MHGEIQIERMWKKKDLSKNTQKIKNQINKNKGKHFEQVVALRPMPFVILGAFWGSEHTKSLYWSPRFCRRQSPTWMVMIQKRRQRETEFMYTTSRTYQQWTWSVHSCYELLGWKQTWHSFVCTEIPSTNKARRSEFSVRYIRWKHLLKPFCTETAFTFKKNKKCCLHQHCTIEHFSTEILLKSVDHPPSPLELLMYLRTCQLLFLKQCHI